MNKGAFTACQIKDLSAPALSLRHNGGLERLRLDGFAHANPSATSTPSVGSLSQSQVWLSSSFAFTLAEVLITLAVIGVVAALTIPAVVRNYQKTQTITQLKKVYSALSNTTNLAIAAEGPVSGWELGEDSNGQAASDFADKYLIPYLKVAKNCGTKTTDDCAYRYKNKANTTSVLGNQYLRFYLNDGTFIALRIENNTSAPAFTVTTTVDINGQKPPNLLGRDVFSYRYILLHRDYPKQTGKFIPNCLGNLDRNSLLNNTSYGCNKTGSCCAALIMVDGWKISDDYLW